nr:immunoglobulin heavy chain junction region [Macaca mulatta]MOW75419.1 immunoglobulin heavy chain junction region [Macaca mulatta]MOW76302.1 immunoglobulin heavy chain junction region [Macaca mulatta]MOW76605.1 immunoglobulin heavy chain junction region [Macaca mulatta]MOW77131.1 immunoglobulin heavy chain junction region [Macaca mulatta]
CTNGITGLDYW